MQLDRTLREYWRVRTERYGSSDSFSEPRPGHMPNRKGKRSTPAAVKPERAKAGRHLREMSPAQVRTYMEMAVRIMQESVAEPRDDGKASPKVGAVLVKPDGTFTTACRGELRDGDHAEFTLLERKHRHEKLDGSVLFATLEPCARGRKRPQNGMREADCVSPHQKGLDRNRRSRSNR